MNILRHTLYLLLIVIIATPLWSQQVQHVYKIQVASYAGPDFNHFKNIRKIGYVYSVPQTNGIAKIMMGDFAKMSTAKQKLTQIKKKGYKDAFIVKTVLKTNTPVYIIQLATYDQNDDIYWSDWLRMSQKLVGQLNDQHIRVGIGPFYTQTEANAQLERLSALGPKDMFIKKVSEKALHRINNFEFQQSSFYKLNTGKERNSVKAIQELLKNQNIYTGKNSGIANKATQNAMLSFKTKNDRYIRYQTQGKSFSKNSFIEEYSLQYYVNLIAKNPELAAQGLRKFKHPMAKTYLAYMYLNKDVVTPENESVNNLMFKATQQVFKNFREDSRYDFSMKYHYEDLEQLLLHIKSIYEVVKLRPDFPCWMFQRHPETCAKVFTPYWNTNRDNYGISTDCKSFLDIEGMPTLIAISKEFASDSREIKNIGIINQTFVIPAPVKYQQIEALEQWNGKLWASLKDWSMGSALQSNMYTTLRFSYYEVLYNLENHFLSKGLPRLEARALSLNTIKESIGCYLDDYCTK